jgi:hypothetical protein
MNPADTQLQYYLTAIAFGLYEPQQCITLSIILFVVDALRLCEHLNIKIFGVNFNLVETRGRFSTKIRLTGEQSFAWHMKLMKLTGVGCNQAVLASLYPPDVICTH